VEVTGKGFGAAVKFIEAMLGANPEDIWVVVILHNGFHMSNRKQRFG
jgi:hypothetical protein